MTSFAEFQELRRVVESAGAPRHHGVSSDALVLYGFNRGPRPTTPGQPVAPGASSWRGVECGTDYPHDRSDLGACRRVVALARRVGVDLDVVDRMVPVLEEFRSWVEEGRNRYGDLIQVVDR